MALVYAPALSFLAFLSALCLAQAIRPAQDIMKRIAVTSILVLCLSVLAFELVAAKIDFWSYLILYALLIAGFVQAFAILYKSVSLRVLHDIDIEGANGKTLDRLYSDNILRSFDRRLHVLQDQGLISVQDNSVSLTSKGLNTAETIKRVQRLLGISTSG